MSIRRHLTCFLRGLAVAGALLSLPSLADAGYSALYKVTARKGNKTFKTDAFIVYYNNQISGREVRSGKQVRMGMPEFTRLEIRDGRYTFQFPPACKDGKPRTLVLDNARFAPSIHLRDPSLCALAPTEVVLGPSGKAPDCSMSKALRAKVAKLEKECEQEGGCGDFEPCSFAYDKNYRPCEQLFSSGPLEGELTSLDRLEGPEYDPANRAQTAAACRAGNRAACTDLIPERPKTIRCNARFSNGTGFGTSVESEAECMLRGYHHILSAQCQDGQRIDGQVFFAPQGAAEKWQPVLTPPPQEMLESIQADPARP